MRVRGRSGSPAQALREPDDGEEVEYQFVGFEKGSNPKPALHYDCRHTTISLAWKKVSLPPGTAVKSPIYPLRALTQPIAGPPILAP